MSDIKHPALTGFEIAAGLALARKNAQDHEQYGDNGDVWEMTLSIVGGFMISAFLLIFPTMGVFHACGKAVASLFYFGILIPFNVLWFKRQVRLCGERIRGETEQHRREVLSRRAVRTAAISAFSRDGYA